MNGDKNRFISRWLLPVILLLALWASRGAALESLPLHNDEGLHLSRAVEVWNLHPFWDISDGKIVNHWPIAFFYPQNAPVFAGRIATVFVALIGMAAGYALARHLFGSTAAWLAGVLWIACPYLFFYERMALSDAEAGALAVVTIWASLRLAERGRIRDAVIVGLALAAAILFKFTAAPFAASVALIVLLMGRVPLRRRMINLVIVAGVVLICFAPPVIYLLLKNGDFSVALGWISQTGERFTAVENAARLAAQLVGFGPPIWTVCLLVGLIALLLIGAKRNTILTRLSRWPGGVLILAGLLPVAAITVLGTEALPRHYVVGLPIALVLAGMGLGAARDHIPARQAQWAAAIMTAILALGIYPFALTAYRDPGNLPLPDQVGGQYITDHSSGFGLREAVLDFPRTIGTPGTPIIASMFPDSCRRANFYAADGFAMHCVDAPGLEIINAALAEQGSVYVLAERPTIGIDVHTLATNATLIASYPRPGETEATASVTLWRLEAP